MAMTAAGEASAQGVANVLNWREVEAPGRLQIFAVLVAALGFAFDLGEIAFGSALSGLFSAPPYAIAPGQLSWLLAATYAGAIIGPPLVCPFADRRGRRTALSAALLLLAVPRRPARPARHSFAHHRRRHPRDRARRATGG